MEKNGNSWTPGDQIVVNIPGEKVAGSMQGEVLEVDPDKEMVRVKLGTATRWVNLDHVKRPGEGDQ
jgi:multidrug efflux pump subunit AcrA (membrane-fusion protein)